MTKKNLITMMVAATLPLCFPAHANAQEEGFGEYKGVWANAHSEAVVTDSLVMYFSRDAQTGDGYAALLLPTCDIHVLTTFSPDTVTTSEAPAYKLAKTTDGALLIDGDTLRMAERIETTVPYDMPPCTEWNQVGQRLREWQLGTRCYIGDDGLQVMVGTNRNSFMYALFDNMVYLRAAALLQCDYGSLFIQNIRMMKNRNTGEFSNMHFDDHLAFLTHLPPIDLSKFAADRCVFADNGQIYWSYISHTPDNIKINGCGETYDIGRPKKESLMEWIKSEPYTANTINAPRIMAPR